MAPDQAAATIGATAGGLRSAGLPPTAPPPTGTATDQNRRATADGRFLVVRPICTHFGCVLLSRAGDFEGDVLCPCHSAQFDATGNRMTGPAMKNLVIPRFRLLDETHLELLPGP